MNYTFASSVKVISNGRKNHYKVFCNGDLIGERKSSRSYGWVLVGRLSYDAAVRQAKMFRGYRSREADRYEADAKDPNRHPLECQQRLEWASMARECAAKYAVELARLASLNQDSPEFAAYHVVEFSNTRRIAGWVAEYWHGLQFVDLPKA